MKRRSFLGRVLAAALAPLGIGGRHKEIEIIRSKPWIQEPQAFTVPRHLWRESGGVIQMFIGGRWVPCQRPRE
jgi:hypothetical protein